MTRLCSITIQISSSPSGAIMKDKSILPRGKEAPCRILMALLGAVTQISIERKNKLRISCCRCRRRHRRRLDPNISLCLTPFPQYLCQSLNLVLGEGETSCVLRYQSDVSALVNYALSLPAALRRRLAECFSPFSPFEPFNPPYQP